MPSPARSLALLAVLALPAACQPGKATAPEPLLEITAPPSVHAEATPALLDMPRALTDAAPAPEVVAGAAEAPADGEISVETAGPFPLIYGDPARIAAIGAPSAPYDPDFQEGAREPIPVWDNWTHAIGPSENEVLQTQHENALRLEAGPVILRAYYPQASSDPNAGLRTLVLELQTNSVVGPDLRLFLHDASGWREFGRFSRGTYLEAIIVAYEKQGSRLRVSPPDMLPVWLDTDRFPDLALRASTIGEIVASAAELNRTDTSTTNFLTVLSHPSDTAAPVLEANEAGVEAYLASQGLISVGANFEVVPAGDAQGDWLPVEALIYLDGSDQYCGVPEESQIMRVPGWLRFRAPDGVHLLRHYSATC